MSENENSKIETLRVVKADLRVNRPNTPMPEPPVNDDVPFFRKLAIETYKKLSEIYGSPYPSSTEERILSIKLLDEEFSKGLNPEYVIFKMKQLAKMTEFKSKVSAVILDRFWDKTFVKGVEYRPFDIKKNL